MKKFLEHFEKFSTQQTDKRTDVVLFKYTFAYLQHHFNIRFLVLQTPCGTTNVVVVVVVVRTHTLPMALLIQINAAW